MHLNPRRCQILNQSAMRESVIFTNLSEFPANWQPPGSTHPFTLCASKPAVHNCLYEERSKDFAQTNYSAAWKIQKRRTPDSSFNKAHPGQTVNLQTATFHLLSMWAAASHHYWVWEEGPGRTFGTCPAHQHGCRRKRKKYVIITKTVGPHDYSTHG